MHAFVQIDQSIKLKHILYSKQTNDISKTHTIIDLPSVRTSLKHSHSLGKIFLYSVTTNCITGLDHNCVHIKSHFNKITI